MPSTTLLTARTPAALAAVTVLLQIGYPLAHGSLRDRLTVVTVLAFFAASVTHAVATRGRDWAVGLVALSAGLGLLAETVGVRTGIPFGHYAYGSSLGPKVLRVPLVIPLAWAMFAYPCLLVGQRLASGWCAVIIGSLALASWDLFLDPQMVAAHHWTWHQGGPALNGIPLANTAGWLAVSLLLMTLLSRLPQRDADDRVPSALFLWTYASSVLANAAFFGRPGVALAGGLAMGLIAVPLLIA
jgi:carotene biosynthesis associated membrane protein